MATHYLDRQSLINQGLSIDYTDMLGRRAFSGGKGYIYAYSVGTSTAKTPYRICYTAGTAATMPSVAALTDGAYMNLVVVPTRTLGAGDTDWFQCEGLVTAVILQSHDYTPTYALRVYDGAVAEIEAVPTGGNTEIGFTNARLSTGAVTAADIFLFGQPALGTT